MNTKTTCKLPKRGKNRPWIWFVLAMWWLTQVTQDVHAGKTYIWDLLAAILNLLLGVYFYRQTRSGR